MFSQLDEYRAMLLAGDTRFALLIGTYRGKM